MSSDTRGGGLPEMQSPIEHREPLACPLCRARIDENCVTLTGRKLFDPQPNPFAKGPPLYGEHRLRRWYRAFKWWRMGLRSH